jgi:hypothetical protein
MPESDNFLSSAHPVCVVECTAVVSEAEPKQLPPKAQCGKFWKVELNAVDAWRKARGIGYLPDSDDIVAHEVVCFERFPLKPLLDHAKMQAKEL